MQRRAPNRGLGRLAVLCISWLMAYGMASAETPRVYTPGALERIAQVRAGKPFLVVMWSLDCVVCMQELDLLALALRAHPAMDLVLISTDEASSVDEVAAVLDKKGLAKAEAWIFSGDDAQRLRYDIDPAWYGELPRTYFYDGKHQREAISGAVNKTRLMAWAAAGAG